MLQFLQVIHTSTLMSASRTSRRVVSSRWDSPETSQSSLPRNNHQKNQKKKNDREQGQSTVSTRLQMRRMWCKGSHPIRLLLEMWPQLPSKLWRSRRAMIPLSLRCPSSKLHPWLSLVKKRNPRSLPPSLVKRPLTSSNSVTTLSSPVKGTTPALSMTQCT